MPLTLSPVTVAPAGSFVASGRAKAKTLTGLYSRAPGTTVVGTQLVQFTTGGSGRFSRTLKAPATTSEIVLRQRTGSAGQWEQGDVKLLLVAGGGGGGTTPLPPNPDPPPDVTPPTVSGVTITVTGQTTATVACTTNEASTVIVEYGTTTGYGSQTAATSSGTTHSRNLTGLTAGTLYHCRIRATDTAGNLRLDQDRTFTTQGTVVVPPPPPPPPPLTGVVINPGTGTIAAAIANGDLNLILRGGTYKDSFGSTQRTDTVQLRNYPGETPIIDGTGLAQNFLYLGTGNWTLTGIRIQGFRPVNSGVLANKDGTLTLDGCTVVGLGAQDSTSQLVYGFGTGTTTVKNSSRLINAPGGAFQLYTNGGADPVGVVTDTELNSLYRGAFVYDGTATFTRVVFSGSAPWNIEVQSDATATLNSCTGTGVGGAVTRLDV
jgi:hypothetical protein